MAGQAKERPEPVSPGKRLGDSGWARQWSEAVAKTERAGSAFGELQR